MFARLTGAAVPGLRVFVMLAVGWFLVVSAFALEGGSDAGDLAAEKIRAAERTETPAERNRLIDEALAILDQILATSPSPQAVMRSRFDRLLALRVSERWSEVIVAWREFENEGIEPPSYVIEAAADAYLALSQPGQAEILYRRRLANEPERHNTRIGLFYALIEQEDYAGGLGVIDALVEDSMAGDDRWQQIEARATAAMARAWANDHGAALARLEALAQEHPDNARVLRDLATVQRWRGWPRAASRNAERAAEAAPGNTGIALLRANLDADLGRHARADERFNALYASNPENTQVERDFRVWQRRQRWHYSLEGEYGDSDGVNEFGSRDRGFGIRLAAPWLGNHLQPYFSWRYNDATFPEGQADYDRIGAGLAWRHRQHHAYLEAHRSRIGSSESGLTAGYNRQLDDHWSLAVRYESFTTDVPLRGRGQGLDGWKAETSARWQAHESLGVRMNISRLNLSDGNVRYAALVGVQHRLRASAHHVTEASLDLYGSRASQIGGFYFNPERDGSLTYVIEHDWLTWRRYERRLNQRFIFGGGGYWQEGFGTRPIGLARYEHVWQLMPGLNLRYGVGLASRVYDGDREQRLDLRFGLEGYF